MSENNEGMLTSIIKGVVISLAVTGIVTLIGTMYSGDSVFNQKKVENPSSTLNNAAPPTPNDNPSTKQTIPSKVMSQKVCLVKVFTE